MKKSVLGKIVLILSMTVLLTACDNNAFYWLTGKPKTTPPLNGPTQTQNKKESGEKALVKTNEQTVPLEQPKPSEHYLQADRSPPQYPALKKNCVTVNGQQVCGYDCKTSNGQAKCAQDPKQRCVTGADGNISCGYDCKKTDTQASCGKYLYSNCVTNTRGEVLCGNNCYEREDSELICGK